MKTLFGMVRGVRDTIDDAPAEFSARLMMRSGADRH